MSEAQAVGGGSLRIGASAYCRIVYASVGRFARLDSISVDREAVNVLFLCARSEIEMARPWHGMPVCWHSEQEHGRIFQAHTAKSLALGVWDPSFFPHHPGVHGQYVQQNYYKVNVRRMQSDCVSTSDTLQFQSTLACVGNYIADLGRTDVNGSR